MDRRMQWQFHYYINNELIYRDEDITIIPEEYREMAQKQADRALWNYYSVKPIEPLNITKDNGTQISIHYFPVTKAGGC